MISRIFNSCSPVVCRYAVHTYAATWYTVLPLRSTHLRRYVVHSLAATQYTPKLNSIQRLGVSYLWSPLNVSQVTLGIFGKSVRWTTVNKTMEDT